MMGAAARKQVVFATPPLAFNRTDALSYMGVAEKLFASLERAGTVTGRRIGRNGETMYYREQLDRVVASLFGAGATDIDDEFEGIGG